MKRGLKGGISIDADSGPCRYVPSMYFDAAVVFVTFIQISCGHTVCG